MQNQIFVVDTYQFVMVNQAAEEIIWENKNGYVQLLKSYIQELQDYSIFFDPDLSQIQKIAEQFIYKTHDHGFKSSDSYRNPDQLWEEFKKGNLQKLHSPNYAKNSRMSM